MVNVEHNSWRARASSLANGAHGLRWDVPTKGFAPLETFRNRPVVHAEYKPVSVRLLVAGGIGLLVLDRVCVHRENRTARAVASVEHKLVCVVIPAVGEPLEGVQTPESATMAL